MAFDPLLTERLIIRAPRPQDLDALVERRNEPEVAQYQNWETPYRREQAETLLTGSVAQGGLQNDQWWMATITSRSDSDSDGDSHSDSSDGGDEVIGDLAIHIGAGWRTAEIGYSLHHRHWGNGYATEAAGALVRHLFHDVGVQRVTAMLHPDNTASAMLLERCGFLFEGRTKLSFWLGEGPEADNSDDLLYGLTRADWESWRARPMGRPQRVELVAVTEDNQLSVAKLVTHKSQEHLVATVLQSYGDALFAGLGGDGRPPLLQVIEADGEQAGFVMTVITGDGPEPEPYLWRLLIDRTKQRRGIGGMALDQLDQMFRADGYSSILVSWAPGKGSPEPFYLARGFEPTGRIEDGEIEARKRL